MPCSVSRRSIFASSRSSLSLDCDEPQKVEQCQALRLPDELQKPDCQFSNVEEKNCGKKSHQVRACPCCSASFRSVITWKMNCPAQESPAWLIHAPAAALALNHGR